MEIKTSYRELNEGRGLAAVGRAAYPPTPTLELMGLLSGEPAVNSKACDSTRLQLGNSSDFSTLYTRRSDRNRGSGLNLVTVYLCDSTHVMIRSSVSLHRRSGSNLQVLVITRDTPQETPISYNVGSRGYANPPVCTAAYTGFTTGMKSWNGAREARLGWT